MRFKKTPIFHESEDEKYTKDLSWLMPAICFGVKKGTLFDPHPLDPIYIIHYT